MKHRRLFIIATVLLVLNAVFFGVNLWKGYTISAFLSAAGCFALGFAISYSWRIEDDVKRIKDLMGTASKNSMAKRR